MKITVASLWRYPVKSMGGEEMRSVALTSDGILGDREYAFESTGAPAGMLRVTGSERRELLRYRAFTGDSRVMVMNPAGSILPVADTNLLHDLPTPHMLTLTRASTPQTDCRPLALISMQTIQHLSSEAGHFLDARRFRANLYLDASEPFAEDTLVGEMLRLGSDAIVRITERDPRCRFITLDPDSTEPFPELMKVLDRQHQGRAGIYAAVIQPGIVRQGDDCSIL